MALSLCLLQTYWLKFPGQVVGSLVGDVKLLYTFVFPFMITTMNVCYCYSKKSTGQGRKQLKSRLKLKPKQRSDLSPGSMRKFPKAPSLY